MTTCKICQHNLQLDTTHCPQCGYLHPDSEYNTTSIRSGIFQLIVQQALAGQQNWQEEWADRMIQNYITPKEVQEEIRRRGDSGESTAFVPRSPRTPDGFGNAVLPPSTDETL
ncbi:MAG: hypothetical protein JST89_22030 [Cyanobacteria bacterium SZAS-4]|nr:hypothetical protein [Cyanobacteria bacterium SZAS-4]